MRNLIAWVWFLLLVSAVLAPILAIGFHKQWLWNWWHHLGVVCAPWGALWLWHQVVGGFDSSDVPKWIFFAWTVVLVAACTWERKQVDQLLICGVQGNGKH